MKRSPTYMYLAAFAVVVFAFLSCKPSVPSRFLQPDEMEDILYDYYLAEGISDLNGNDTTAMIAFRTSILNKHGVSEALFDSSMVYYTRHTKELHDIYQSLSDRLNDEAVAQGSSSSEADRYGSLSSSSDTTDVWKGERAIILSPYVACNSYSFSMEADTSYYKGDRIILDFDAQFIYQDGTRDAVAVLAVTFGNDSVASQVARVSSTSSYHLQIEDAQRLGIKSVSGYFLVNDNAGAYSVPSTTLRLFVISGIRLVRMHIKESPAPTAPADSLSVGDSTCNRGRQTDVPSSVPAPGAVGEGIRNERIRP